MYTHFCNIMPKMMINISGPLRMFFFHARSIIFTNYGVIPIQQNTRVYCQSRWAYGHQHMENMEREALHMDVFGFTDHNYQ